MESVLARFIRVELAELRETVFFRTSGQGNFALVQQASSPARLDDGVLQRSRVREGHVPGFGCWFITSVQGGVQFGQTARQEHDTGRGRRDARVQHVQVNPTLFGVFLGSRHRANHGRLQQHAVEHDVVVRQVLEGFRPDRGGDFIGFFQGVLTVEEDFGSTIGTKPAFCRCTYLAKYAQSVTAILTSQTDGDDGSPFARRLACSIPRLCRQASKPWHQDSPFAVRKQSHPLSTLIPG